MTHDITFVELHSALAGRRQRKVISERAYQRALRDIEQDWPIFRHVAVDQGLLQQAAGLAGTYYLRAYDAVHLAAVQAVAPLGVQFITFDLKLRAVAEQVLPGQVWQP